MDNYETEGILNDSGFQSVDSEEKSSGTTSYNSGTSEGNDRLGVKHWPKLFSYMETHSSFSASVLSIIGYVIIAAFGSMETLGQYLGYIIFLSVIGFIYNFNKKDTKKLYLLMFIILGMFLLIVFQNWGTISSYYRKINHPFKIDVKVEEAKKNLIP